MKLVPGGSFSDLKMVDSKGKEVGHVSKGNNGHWWAILPDGTPITHRNGGWVEGKGYLSADDAGSALIHVVTRGRGI